jgi:hypothetical protein
MAVLKRRSDLIPLLVMNESREPDKDHHVVADAAVRQQSLGKHR